MNKNIDWLVLGFNKFLLAEGFITDKDSAEEDESKGWSKVYDSFVAYVIVMFDDVYGNYYVTCNLEDIIYNTMKWYRNMPELKKYRASTTFEYFCAENENMPFSL